MTPDNFAIWASKIGPSKVLGSIFGRTDFSRIFVFGPPDFFADFVARFFLLIFSEKNKGGWKIRGGENIP